MRRVSDEKKAAIAKMIAAGETTAAIMKKLQCGQATVQAVREAQASDGNDDGGGETRDPKASKGLRARIEELEEHNAYWEGRAGELLEHIAEQSMELVRINKLLREATEA